MSNMGEPIGSRRVRKVSVSIEGIKHANRNRPGEQAFLESDNLKVIGAFDWQIKSYSKHMLYRGLSHFGNDKKFSPRAYVYLERWERPKKAKGLQYGKTISGAGLAALIGDKFWHRWILTIRMTPLGRTQLTGTLKLVKRYGRPFSCIQLAHDLSSHYTRHYNGNQFANGVTDGASVVGSMLG